MDACWDGVGVLVGVVCVVTGVIRWRLTVDVCVGDMNRVSGSRGI